MSQLKTNSITNIGNTGDANIVLGANGDTQVQSLNSGPLSGFRNYLLGNFYVWQRSVSENTPANDNYSTADRWIVRGTTQTGGAVINSRAYLDNNKTQALRFTVTTPTTSHLSTYQKIEAVNCRHLAGKTVTFSAYTSFTPVLTVGYRDSSDVIQFVTGTTDSLGDNRYSITVTLPDVQFGSDFDKTGLEVFVETALNTSVPNGQYNIWHPQLEPGPVATPFEHRPIGTELALCQRYFEKMVITKHPMFPAGNNGVNSETFVPFHVQKRASSTNPKISKSGDMTVFFNGTSSVNTDHGLESTVDGARVFVVIPGANYTSSIGINNVTLLADAEL